MTYLEELLCNVDASKPIHLLLASPGGDGETAIRMVRSIQARCSELTVVIPDMAKSAATLLCLGADRILMGPAGDLGPVDPQFPIGRGLVGAKEIVAAVDEAEERINGSPESYALFASLLADVNMIMVRQARSALDRSGALVREALGCAHGRSLSEVDKLTETLQAPLIDEPASHGTVVSAAQAAEFGLPVESLDVQSEQWHLIWALWTRYFSLGCFPAGGTAVYEGRRASKTITPAPYPLGAQPSDDNK
ncbi:peptidase [Catellatospora citrea]|uniref:Peptidase n=2 Tax=Catellatospora citrea TaxID=53366 RepID=A0A8J3KTT6_9ACTN|nr:peptidase [Catellatospora citrea]